MKSPARFLALPALALLVLTACGGADQGTADPTETGSPAAAASAPTTEFVGESETGVRTESGYHLNAVTEGAPTVTLFTDIQCPYCAIADPTYARVAAELEGTMNVTVKHFPLPMHANAVPAAQAVQAAELQGAHQQMSNHLFNQQDEWKSITEADTLISTFAGYAEQLGLDREQFETDLMDGDQLALIQQEYAEGREAGVSGTPQFVVGGAVVEGVESSTSEADMISAFKSAAGL